MDEPERYISTKEDNLLLDYFKAWGIIIPLNAMVLISIYVKAIYGWGLNTALIRFLPPLVLIDGYIIYIILSDRHRHNLKSIVLHDSHIELIVLKDVFMNNTDMIFYFQSSDCIAQNYTKPKHLDFVFDNGHRYILNSEWFEDYDEIVTKIKSKNIPITEIEE